MDKELLSLLVCPVCKGPLDFRKPEEELVCHNDALAFPVRDGIPVMLTDEARHLEESK
ncbi:MAG: Trm112 family protein [Magnetococcales bacterium]|nr:Trm112 family protein [Magnetococcales bacterium]